MANDHTPGFRIIELFAGDPQAEFARDVVDGLTASPKRLECRYFYDDEGSRLFEAICELPEYYLTRAETAILRDHAHEIAGYFPADVTVVEFGSGNAVKTQLLLEALLLGQGGQKGDCPLKEGGQSPFCPPCPSVRYVPIDICRPVLEESSRALLQKFPGLEIVAVAAEYQEGLQRLSAESDRPKLILWLGSNIGNLDRTEATAFLRRIRDTLQSADRVLVGFDLRKDRAILEPAYDDAAGVTAAFNLNLLARINRELDGDFDLAAFRHRAIYDPDLGRIEMHLVSTRSQRVTIGRLGLEVAFAAGETIHTENSYKYSLTEMDEVCRSAGLHAERCWQDTEGQFGVHLLRIDPVER
jgi:dimethylhistidine N-methyltransferase